MIPDMPLFGLRRKPSSMGCPTINDGVDFDDALNTLGVMTAQDSHYRCNDYFGRSRSKELQHHHGGGSLTTSLSASSVITTATNNTTSNVTFPEYAIDHICREKMCEWSYRVCDHFRTTREVVAFSFSFLDRFIDTYPNCNRNTFKLASMTSFYIATKMLNVTKQISLIGLAELSRGEYNINHIANMEQFILSKLQWKMNPPTIHAFISYLRIILPIPTKHDRNTHDDIYHRSIFFAEISVYDYMFVTEERYILAIACILNAIEGAIDNIHYVKELRTEYLHTIHTNLCVEIDYMLLDRTQKRLWYLYSCSAQIQYEDIIPVQCITATSLCNHKKSDQQQRQQNQNNQSLNGNVNDVNNYDNSSLDYSPVGVGFA